MTQAKKLELIEEHPPNHETISMCSRLNSDVAKPGVTQERSPGPLGLETQEKLVSKAQDPPLNHFTPNSPAPPGWRLSGAANPASSAPGAMR